MKVILIVATLLVAASGAKLGQNVIEEEVTERPIPYNFGFRVQDDETTNYQNRAEVADENGVRGSYSYVMPDGFVYTITYEDKLDGTGNQVSIRKEASGITVVSPKYDPKELLDASPRA